MGRDDDDTADRCVCTLPASLVLALWFDVYCIALRLFCKLLPVRLTLERQALGMEGSMMAQSDDFASQLGC
jgi:hypothetical protein